MNFKNIHIGSIILQRVNECNIENTRICNFLKCNEIDLQKMYSSESLDSKILLRWSKLLEYDFFRIYSQHLILFSPPNPLNQTDKRNSLPQFRKNLYTKELIDFIVDKIKTDKMTTKQVIENYRIPKTTLHKWLEKNK
ncbi:MAG TPA: transposase [Flavobacteriaceae bacterium]|nr:transposase [Flavobacteriaceae bacterium]